MRTWYYARNKRQFGPVGIEELKRLLGTGGLDAGDLVWREGMAEWLPVSSVSELSAPPLPPEGHFDEAPAPETAPPDDGRDIIPGSQPLLINLCLAHATRRLMSQLRLLLMAGLVYFIAVVGLALLGNWIGEWTGYPMPLTDWMGDDPQMQRQFVNSFGQVSLPIIIIQTLAESFLKLGLMRISLSVLRGEETSLRQMFNIGPRFLKVVVAAFLYYVMVIAGLMLFVAPGIYIATRFSQFPYAILERNLGIMESFSFSAAVTRNSLLPLILLNLIIFITAITGQLFVIGIIPAIPFVVMIQAAIYHWLTKGARAAFEG